MNTRKKVFIACILTTMSVSVKCDAAVSLNTGVKCVKLSSRTTCDFPEYNSSTYSSWKPGEITLNCDGVAVTIISQCANNDAGSGAAVLPDDGLRMVVGDGLNSSCWCKMISPVVSAWVPMGNGSSLCKVDSGDGLIDEGECIKVCAEYLKYGNYNNMFFEHILW